MIKYNFRLDEQTHADILAMSHHVGETGNLTAGLRALIAEWRRLRKEREDRRRRVYDRAADVARHEERLDAQDRHDEATA